ncbi:MAG: 6-phosphofructokinase [Clostridiales bacterium]|jgi:6-phosphofructokinase 1|nr:6-phosphofructokinase [Clostridiales bacterium]
MKNIGVLTSGGDAPGMNACVRAVVRYALEKDMRVYGIYRGYEGLIGGDIKPLERGSVSDIIQRGGTILKTARCKEFETLAGMKKAAYNMKVFGVDGLVVIGGDGSFKGAKELFDNFGVPSVGIPGTIDNDLAYTDYTLGFDTAVNTVLSAINNLRDTMTSHDLANIVEVMGRHCGDIALFAGLAGGAEIILIPEKKVDLEDICEKIRENRVKGKLSNIIVLAEGAGNAEEIQKTIEQETGIQIRTTRLGHIQRGGTPSMADRILGARLGVKAVDLLYEDHEKKVNKVVGIKNNKIVAEDYETALKATSKGHEDLYTIASILCK